MGGAEVTMLRPFLLGQQTQGSYVQGQCATNMGTDISKEVWNQPRCICC